MQNNEIWKPMNGFEGYYEVSNTGKIKSVSRIINAGRGKGQRTMPSTIIVQHVSIAGYHRIVFSIERKRFSKSVHRMVAISFLPNPENKPCVNHKNGIKTDNRLENLEWATHKENDKHAIRIGLKKPTYSTKGLFGSAHNRSKQVSMYDMDGILLEVFGSTQEAKRKTGISQDSIAKVARGERSHTHNRQFKYTSPHEKAV